VSPRGYGGRGFHHSEANRLTHGQERQTRQIAKAIRSNAYQHIPNRGETPPFASEPFSGWPGTVLAVGGVTTTELGPTSVTTPKIAAQAIGTTEINASAVTTGKIAVQAVTTTELAPTSVTGAKIAAQAVSTTELNGNAVTAVKIADLAVTTGKLDTQSVTTEKIGTGQVTLGKMDANATNPAQSIAGLRSIGSLLGGDSTQAAAGNHSHGSGNTHGFDYLPDAHISRILLARQRVRANIRNLDTLTAAQFRLYIRELAIVALCALALEIDAPDLTAEERRQKRQAGETLPDFFEWRRAAALEAEGEEAPLHTHNLPRYMEGQTDVGEVPE
jgi:hypothetical protein